MQQSPTQTATFLVFAASSASAVIIVLVLGRRWQRLQALRDKIITQWKPSLAIAMLFLISYTLGGGFNARNVLSTVTLFCQSLLGLALARTIAGFEPLPIAQSIAKRERAGCSTALMLVIALLVVPLGLIVGNLGTSLGERLFGETSPDIDTSILPSNPWSALFAFFAGSGIAEETIFRLLLLSLVWRSTHRRWLAVTLSAMAFGAYHLTPLNRMYLFFWEFPMSQFLGATLGGLVLGYLYVKRGYETTVLSHTLENWIPFALFLLLAQ